MSNWRARVPSRERRGVTIQEALGERPSLCGERWIPVPRKPSIQLDENKRSPPEPDAAPHLPSRYDELISECSVLCVMADAMPEHVSDRVKERQRREMGTLRSGNHYLEVQAVAEIFDPAVAGTFGLAPDDGVVTIHCGSRGLGHQIGTKFMKETVVTAHASGIALPDRELACAINSEVGQRYLGSCVPRSTARSPIVRSLGHLRGAFSHTSCLAATCACCSTSRTTPASRNPWGRGQTARAVGASKGRHPGLRSGATRACPRRFVPSASPCWSAAAWRRVRTFWWVRRLPSSACHGCRPGAFPPCRAQAVERTQDYR